MSAIFVLWVIFFEHTYNIGRTPYVVYVVEGVVNWMLNGGLCSVMTIGSTPYSIEDRGWRTLIETQLARMTDANVELRCIARDAR